MPIELRSRTSKFKLELKKKFPKIRNPSNLNKIQRAALQYSQTNRELIVVKSDKNLGPCVMERSQYLDLAHQDHLSNEKLIDN